MGLSRRRAVNGFLLLVILVGSLPACGPVGEELSARDQEHSLMLQISSHARLSGEFDLGSYTFLPGGYKVALIKASAAPGVTNEVDILVNLYTSYLNGLHARGNLTDSNVNRLVDQLKGKIQNLNRRSQRLEQRRRRRGRGLARFFRRVGRGIGRFARQLGRGVGKAVEYLIEEVAPEVIQNMVLTGQPLNAKVFWKGVRKVVRSRLKRAIGNRLVRHGVPPEILAEAGLDLEEEPEQEDQGQESATTTEIGYGNHSVEVIEHDGNFGYFTWKAYWSNLPDTFEHRCQRTTLPDVDVEAYLDDYSLTLIFELDAGQLRAETSGAGSDDFTYEVSSYEYSLKTENGWVRPSPDGTGWSFGGDVVFDVVINSQWECLECIPDGEGHCLDVRAYWLEDEKSTSVRGKLEGWTEQVVPGEGDEPDRLEPGGTYYLLIDYEDQAAELFLGCENCTLPGDFPPPVYLDE